MQAARDVNLEDSWIVRALFKARAVMLGAKSTAKRNDKPFVASMEALGWRILADTPGREIVMGTVTQPWEADVRFRGVDAAAFAQYSQPDNVKIVLTLRAQPIDATHCIFHTETRAAATDEAARKRFRRYWAMVWPGVILIRLTLLPMVRRAAEINRRN